PALVVLGALLAGGAAGYVRAGDGGTSKGRTASPRDALQARLPDSVYGSCAPRPEGESPERPASLLCTPATAGVDELLVTQWRDPAAMDADWETTFVGGRYREAPCSSYEGLPGTARRSTWTAPSGAAPLACYLNEPGAAIVMWEYPEQALQVRLVRKDGDYAAAFRWWREAKDVPLEGS
ncbi:MAG: hypothetical protein JWO60_1839, partial [Frankiales bacterium]|nr:hypothetical protein [Frankiales bacterium]